MRNLGAAGVEPAASELGGFTDRCPAVGLRAQPPRRASNLDLPLQRRPCRRLHHGAPRPAGLGFEPRSSASKAAVLPLDDPAKSGGPRPAAAAYGGARTRTSPVKGRLLCPSSSIRAPPRDRVPRLEPPCAGRLLIFQRSRVASPARGRRAEARPSPALAPQARRPNRRRRRCATTDAASRSVPVIQRSKTHASYGEAWVKRPDPHASRAAWGSGPPIRSG